MPEKPQGKITKSRVKERIDENLRRVYQEMLDQEVPEHIWQLLNDLRGKAADR